MQLNLNLELFEFFRNYTKLAMLSLKVYLKKSKENSAKKLTAMMIEHGTSCFYYDALPTELTWQVFTEG